MHSRPRPVSRVEVVVVVVRVAARVGVLLMIGWYTARRAGVKARSRYRSDLCGVDDAHGGGGRRERRRPIGAADREGITYIFSDDNRKIRSVIVAGQRGTVIL
jgi:hypothetical protein